MLIRIMWIISKSHRDFFIFFLLIFAISSSSRHEKRCQMLVRLFFGYFNTLETQSDLFGGLFCKNFFYRDLQKLLIFKSFQDFCMTFVRTEPSDDMYTYLCAVESYHFSFICNWYHDLGCGVLILGIQN